MSYTELDKVDTYPYIDFVQSLSMRDGVVAKLANLFLDGARSGEIKILPNSHALTSRLSLDKSVVTVFLPQGYDDSKAIFEAPRIIVETLRNINRLPHGQNIEDQFRSELV